MQSTEPAHSSEPTHAEHVVPSEPVKVVRRRPTVGVLPKKVPLVEVEYVAELLDETRALLQTNFMKCIKGYHLVNDDPIKEAPWENINTIVLNASGCPVLSKSNGSHQSGGDISCSLGLFSNKSTQYEKGNQMFKISSYRLTTVCSDKDPGEISAIVGEINKRKNFNYYSIIVRDQVNDKIRYDWYLIPSDYSVFDPATYEWVPKIGKIGKNKGEIVGWETNTVAGSSMSISFSMSSQLWLDIAVTDQMKSFIVGSCEVTIGKKYNYIELYENSL